MRDSTFSKRSLLSTKVNPKIASLFTLCANCLQSTASYISANSGYWSQRSSIRMRPPTQTFDRYPHRERAVAIHSSPSVSDVTYWQTTPLGRLEGRLDHLASCFSTLAHISRPSEDLDTDRIFHGSIPRTDVSSESEEEFTSRASSPSCWIPSLTSCDTRGSNETPEVVSTFQSNNPYRNGLSAGTKRTLGAVNEDGSEEPDEPNRKSSKRSIDPPDLNFDAASEKTETQIPCIVDDCAGKDKHISTLM